MAKPPPSVDTTDAAALAQVQVYCGWHIAPARSDVATLDGPGSRVLVLPSLRVTDVASIEEDGVTLDPSAYEWSRAGVVRRLASTSYWSSCQPRWTNHLRGLVVTFTHGFDTMPADLQQVIDDLSARLGSGFGGLVSQSVGPFTESYGQPSTAAMGSNLATLNSYRLARLP